MEVVHERGVVPLRVLRPDAGLSSTGRAARDGSLEERIDGVAPGRVERHVRSCRDRPSAGDREVVQVVRAIGDAVLLHVELRVAERGQGGRVQTPARVEILDDEQNVVHHDTPDGHDTVRRSAA